jgi:DNA invertase Pin-like site-specific DNA recombinase
MDRLARNLDDLRQIVRTLTGRGIRVEFFKEGLTFTGEDAPMAIPLLSVIGVSAEFERALIREGQREGVALAKQRGACRGRKQALNAVERAEARARVATGEQKAAVARSYGISRETLYQYLRMAEDEKETIGKEARLLS